jgi:hypothetical protein
MRTWVPLLMLPLVPLLMLPLVLHYHGHVH